MQLYRQVMEGDVWVPRTSASRQSLCVREDGKQLDAKLVLAVTVRLIICYYLITYNSIETQSWQRKEIYQVVDFLSSCQYVAVQ